MSFKQAVAEKYAQLVYDGLCSPPKEGIGCFVDSTQENVTGGLGLSSTRGTVGGRLNPHILYIMRTLSPLGRMRCTIKRMPRALSTSMDSLTISALMKEKLEKSKEWEENRTGAI